MSKTWTPEDDVALATEVLQVRAPRPVVRRATRAMLKAAERDAKAAAGVAISAQMKERHERARA